MRITFVSGSLAAGGAERVLVLLTEGLQRRGHALSVVTLNGRDQDFFDLPCGVERIAIGARGLIRTLFGLPKLRRSILSTRPDVVISFIDRMNILTLLVTRRLQLPIVVSERVDPALYSIGNIWEKLREWTYPSADRIIVQTARAADYFLPQFQSSICIIPNPVLPPPLENGDIGPLYRPCLIAMGRFHPQKGFDLLLKAFDLVKDRHPQWKLIILGDGKLRAELTTLCSELKLNDRVEFPGRVKNPHAVLKRSDLFVLSSRFEGFPNALCEAMACGLPVISTDCPSGPREIIRDGIDGVLVPSDDIGSLSKAIDRLMSNEAERRRLASRAPEILDRFSMGKIVALWEEVLVQVVGESRSA